jgi:hypothetical protein
MTRSPEASREAAMAHIRGVESLSQPSKRLYSVLMPAEITAALEKATQEDGISSADLIRQAVADHLRRKGYLPKG